MKNHSGTTGMKTCFFISTGTLGVTPARFLRRLLPGADRTILPSVIGGLAARHAEKVRVRTGRGGQDPLSTVGRLLCLLVAALLGFSISGSALAQDESWPTTKWQVMTDRKVQAFNNKEEKILIDFYEHEMGLASQWFQSIGFPPPLAQKSIDSSGRDVFVARLIPPAKDGSVDTGAYHESYSKRSDSRQGRINLSRHIGFINPKDPTDHLMRAGMVHEMFHGIQAAMAPQNLYDWRYASAENKAGFSSCDSSDRGLDSWLWEGAAAFIQIAWLEDRYKIPRWGHPFTDDYNGRAVWMRHYDQGLDSPKISEPMKNFGKVPFKEYCGYGTWYFWYALGEFFSGDANPKSKPSPSLTANEKGEINRRRFGYIKHIHEVPGPWEETGIEGVDKGLKNAVLQYEKEGIMLPRSYRGGLYYFYPRFVAEYLNADGFFNEVTHVDLMDQSIYDVTSEEIGKIDPNGARAWRINVKLPDAAPDRMASAAPVAIRFGLFPIFGPMDEDLHLIIDDKVIPHPASLMFSDYIYRTDTSVEARKWNPEKGSFEFFVRIANIAKKPEESESTSYRLLVEVDGYYGAKP